MSNAVSTGFKYLFILALPWIVIFLGTAGVIGWVMRDVSSPISTTGSSSTQTGTVECPGLPTSVDLTQTWKEVNPGARCNLSVLSYSGTIEIGAGKNIIEINAQTPNTNMPPGTKPAWARAKYGSAQMVMLLCDRRSAGVTRWTNACQPF